jgi:hypothetical protein
MSNGTATERMRIFSTNMNPTFEDGSDIDVHPALC